MICSDIVHAAAEAAIFAAVAFAVAGQDLVEWGCEV
jgi:hypothetical protein